VSESSEDPKRQDIIDRCKFPCQLIKPDTSVSSDSREMEHRATPQGWPEILGSCGKGSTSRWI